MATEYLFDLTKQKLEPAKNEKYPEVIAETTVQLDVKTFSPEKMPGIRDSGGSVLAFALKDRELRPNGTLVWTASVNSSRYETATFAITKGILTASIQLPDGRTFRIVHFKDDQYRLQQIDRTKIPVEACVTSSDWKRSPKPLLPSRPQRVTLGCAPPDPETAIDVMVVYSAAALTEAQGESELINSLEIARGVTNTSYSNSDIKQRLQLLYPMQQVENYTEETNPFDDLDALVAGDPPFDKVHEARTRMAADIVVLVTSSSLNCGTSFTMSKASQAWASNAYVVIPYRCLIDNYSLAHEIGHVMGARHDEVNDATRGSPFVFNHGFAASQPSGGAPAPWMTIMSTNAPCGGTVCTRIPFWSSPDGAFGYYGSATGLAGHADNHQTLNATASVVANFQCSASRTQPR